MSTPAVDKIVVALKATVVNPTVGKKHSAFQVLGSFEAMLSTPIVDERH